MRRVVLSWLALALVAGPVAADEVVVGRIPYADVKVVGFADGKLAFEMNERVIRKPLEEVAKITLAGADAFNQGERLLAEGKGDEAAEKYAAARTKAKTDWLKALIDQRLAAAKGLGGAAPETQPSTAPSTQPAGQVEPAEGPLATPDALAAFLAAKPEHPSKDAQAWKRFRDLEKRIAERKYETQVMLWGNRIRVLRAKKVSWRVIFEEYAAVVRRASVPGPRPPRRPRKATPAGAPDYWRVGYIVKTVTESGLTVLANVLPAKAKALTSLKPKEIVLLTGRIRRDLEPGMAGKTIYLDFAEVTPTGHIYEPAEPKHPGRRKPRPPKPATKPAPPATKPALPFDKGLLGRIRPLFGRPRSRRRR